MKRPSALRIALGLSLPIAAAVYGVWKLQLFQRRAEQKIVEEMTLPPLPVTAEAAHRSGDGRPALEELYKDHADYVRKLTEAGRSLERDRLMLPEDVDATVREAQEQNINLKR